LNLLYEFGDAQQNKLKHKKGRLYESSLHQRRAD
jgi:hypothetical protein